jgi:ribosomal protein S12 methylthiotransferase accessory factor
LYLKSAKKHTFEDGEISSKVKSSKDTLKAIELICKRIGVTRVCDITYLDRLYIPNYSVILPGTEDTIWVYGGKGITKTNAKVSALMESIERYCSLSKTSFKSSIQGNYSELSKSYNKVLHPDEVVEPVVANYNEKLNLDYIPGFDLINNEQVLVPAQLVFSRFSAKPPCVDVFSYSHTNGLASGNVIEEAICQALCEVIERDAISIADLCASSLPYSILQKLTSSLRSLGYYDSQFSKKQDNFVDDASLFSDVNVSEIAENFGPLKYLTERFARAGIPLLIKNITQRDIGIPTFAASSVEWITNDYGYFAIGYGTHLDAKIALIRAITELSQTRAVNIQGARDDFKRVQYEESDKIYNRKWQFMNTIKLHFNKDENKTMMFKEIDSYIFDDILDDVKFILKRLKKAGLRRAIIINLTEPNLGIPVVRALVPGLETFEIAKLFTNSQLYVGRRAKTFFREIYDF